VPRDDFKWTALSTWTSPRTKATYPNHIQIQVRDTDHGNTLRVLELKPLAQDQELGGALSGLPYWEGACDVLDQHGSVIGHAFLELAGYAGDLAGHLRGQ
jgi:predicted secreted hydrolase